MKALILLISSGVLMTAETTKPTSKPTPQPVQPPKTIALTSEENTRIEDLSLKQEAMNRLINDIFTDKCRAIGGNGMGDCRVDGTLQAGFTVTLRPVAPITADAKK